VRISKNRGLSVPAAFSAACSRSDATAATHVPSNAPIPIRQVPAGDTEAVIAEFDKIWLPKAPVLAELRKIGATL